MSKKTSLLLLLLFTGINLIYAQTTTNTFKGSALLGKVTKVTETDFFQRKNADSTFRLDSVFKTVATYDELGNLLVRFNYMRVAQDTTNRLTLLNKYTFHQDKDENGNIRQVVVNSPYKSGVMIYNKQGNEVESDVYKSDGSLSAKTYSIYDKSKKKIEIKYCDAANNVQLARKFKYDKNGNEVESDDYHGTNITVKAFYTYEDFDKNGNWLKRTATIHFENGYPGARRITERQIIYY